MGVIDLHTHSLFSDGELLPSELARRAEVCGYDTIAITDHVDASNLDDVVPKMAAFARDWNACEDRRVRVIAGAEITHAPPSSIGRLVARARELGAGVVVVHGETVAEPVAAGTNMAAVLAGCDILAHPGLIDKELAARAAERNVKLEVTARKGHCLTNGLVVAVGRAAGVRWVIDSDGHAPGDLLDEETVRKVGLGAGMTVEELGETLRTSAALAADCEAK
ncbi:MAG: histidinol phosphate phosphatase domain-containing protein [Candidatus Hydrogenedentes bacterium]|nr:histidinol phosphate phosphatase domain-containing protein [Candidatus Hydrogenedentota bacterium]